VSVIGVAHLVELKKCCNIVINTDDVAAIILHLETCVNLGRTLMCRITAYSSSCIIITDDSGIDRNGYTELAVTVKCRLAADRPTATV